MAKEYILNGKVIYIKWQSNIYYFLHSLSQIEYSVRTSGRYVNMPHLPLYEPKVLRLALALNIFLKEHVLTIKHGVGELRYPVAQYHHARLLR